MIISYERIPHELGNTEMVSAHASISPKAAALATARALKADPTIHTEHLDGASEFCPIRDAPDAEDVVRTKTERYAIIAAAIDIAAADFVTNPSNARDARFMQPLPDTSDPEVLENLNEQGWGGTLPDSDLLKLNNDVSAGIFPIAKDFLSKHPEFGPAADRYKLIAELSIEHDLNAGLATVDRGIGNVTETLGGYVVAEYIPFIQRLLYIARDNSELKTPEQRLEAARDAAQRMVFGLAATNLGHFAKIQAGDTKWQNFLVGDNLEGELVKTAAGKWDVKLAPGSERPPKPKTGLAGDTISCPAMLQLEENDDASPLHRMVYATINEAAERGYFTEEGLQANEDRVEAERLEVERKYEEFIAWRATKESTYGEEATFHSEEAFDQSKEYTRSIE